MLRRRRRILVGVGCTGLLISACSSERSDSDIAAQAESTIATTARSDSASSLPPAETEPGGSLLVRPADQAALLYAESVLAARCMRSVGFPYEVIGYEVLVGWMQASADDAQRNQFPYDASIEGVPYVDPAESTPADPNEAYIRGLDEAAQVAYGDALQGDIQNRIEVAVLGNNAGTPRDGCVSEARTALYGSLEGALVSMILTGNLAPAAHARTRSQLRVADATDLWVECMAGDGFVFANFGEARAAAYARPAEAERIARADDQCTKQSDLAATYVSEFELARSIIIEENAEQFAASQEARITAIQKAQELLAEG